MLGLNEEPVVLKSLFRRHAFLGIVDEASLDEVDRSWVDLRLLILNHVLLKQPAYGLLADGQVTARIEGTFLRADELVRLVTKERRRRLVELLVLLAADVHVLRHITKGDHEVLEQFILILGREQGSSSD